MATFGTHLRLTASRDLRDTLRGFYRSGLQAAHSSPKPDIDVFRLPDGFQIGVCFLPDDQALSQEAAEKGAWLEFVVDDPDAAVDRLVALGATTVEYEDTSHRYLRAPGGQIFRLAVVK